MIVFVTAYKDINRSRWSTYSRTNDEYLNMFLNMGRNIKYKLVVYCEPAMKQSLISYNLPDNIEYRDFDEVKDTFYNKYLDVERAIIESSEYKGKLSPDRLINPEHLYAEYNLINHSKINFIRHTKTIYPDYSFYSWIDFGMCRNPADCPSNVCLSLIPTDKITYLALSDPSVVQRSPLDMLKSHDIYLTGSLFIAPASKVEEFEYLFEQKIQEYHRLCLSDDDQALVVQIYWDVTSMFNIVLDTEWFSLFRKHLNL